MTKEQIEELREKAKQATEGEWFIDGPEVRADIAPYSTDPVTVGVCEVHRLSPQLDHRRADREYIAALNPDTCLKLTSLALEALSLREENARLRELVKEVQNGIGEACRYSEALPSTMTLKKILIHLRDKLRGRNA